MVATNENNEQGNRNYEVDARVAITTHGNVGEVVNLQDRSSVCLYKCETLLNSLCLRLIVDIAVGGIGVREEVPVTDK